MNSTHTSAGTRRFSADDGFVLEMWLSSNSVTLFKHFFSATHSFPTKQHTTKLMKLQHFFKLRNAYFSGQYNPLVCSETTLVLK